MKYRKKPVIIEATQWFKNGDHPLDHDPIGIKNPSSMTLKYYYDYLASEGKIVRRYCDPNIDRNSRCSKCRGLMFDHGWIKTLEGGNNGAQLVCPGDWIITGIRGENYPCKPDIFELTYEAVRNKEE